ncbi:hypothetical protein KUF71_023451 [Frankliniella fusca]|uniref:Uncharacterized protein n=1 Tax=Frankliniella fusca TaxID=407009 RepID=A0AAE1H3T7_9NEOP|nr:hypothetical protein KUF71_023451 [Frankliniella fusca]
MQTVFLQGLNCAALSSPRNSSG